MGHARFRTFAAILLSASLWSAEGYAAPPIIHFQGVLKDSTGEVVEDGVYALKFRIYDDSTAGTVLWETAGFVPLQTTGGLFNHLLGSSNTLPDSVFNSDNLWVSVSVDLDPEMMPRTRLAAMPFAMQANRADTAAVSLDKTVDAGELTIGTLDTTRYSAYSDLVAEGRIGQSSGQVASGNHTHPATFPGGSIRRVEDTTAITQQGSGLLKSVALDSGQSPSFLRVNCSASLSGDGGDWTLEVVVNGFVIGSAFVNQTTAFGTNVALSVSATRLSGNYWTAVTTWAASAGGNQVLIKNGTTSPAMPIVIELRAVAPSAITVNAGTLIVEYDAD